MNEKIAYSTSSTKTAEQPVENVEKTGENVGEAIPPYKGLRQKYVRRWERLMAILALCGQAFG